MTIPEIAARRLMSQRLTGPRLATPTAVVGWLGAVQAQDYGAARWGVAQRAAGVTAANFDQLFDEGSILRTHVLRPTWHFVLPTDIRWLLALTGPRVHAANAYYYRKLELDQSVLGRGRELLTEALRDGGYLTRVELAAALGRGGIKADGQRLAYLLMHAELDGLLCSGPLRGRQFTYALLDARVPPTPPLPRQEALATLTRRYLLSHGPATPQDYAWWSGLTAADVRQGLELVTGEFTQQVVEGRTYWLTPADEPARLARPVMHLLPNYDEHVIAYKDHTASLDEALRNQLKPGDDTLAAHLIVRNGLVIGGWRRTLQQKQAVLATRLPIELNEQEQAALQAAAEAYGRFIALPAVLTPVGSAPTGK